MYRYIGDMLAWIHQCTAGEREILEAILGLSPASRTPTSPFAMSVPMDDEDKVLLNTMLDQAMEGSIRPLRVRIDQVLQSRPGPIIAYKISNLIQFYDSTIASIFSFDESKEGPSSKAKSALSHALSELNQVSHRVFFDTLNAQASALLDLDLEVDISSGLVPPLAVRETITQLKDILASYDDGSLLDEDEKEKEVSRVLSACLDPLLQMCHEASARLGQVEGATFMINCLHMIHVCLCFLFNAQMALVLYPFTGKHVRVLEMQMDTQLETLIGELYMHLLSQSKLATFVFAIENNEEKVYMPCSYPGCPDTIV